MQVGGQVWAMLSTAGDVLGSPWGIVHVHFSAIVMECLKVGACLVWDVLDVIGQV